MLIVTTRAQARRQETEDVIPLQQEAETEAQVTPITTPTPGPDVTDELVGDVSIGSDFSSDLFTPGRMKPRLSRREKQRARQRYAACSTAGGRGLRADTTSCPGNIGRGAATNAERRLIGGCQQGS